MGYELVQNAPALAATRHGCRTLQLLTEIRVRWALAHLACGTVACRLTSAWPCLHILARGIPAFRLASACPCLPPGQHASSDALFLSAEHPSPVLVPKC